MRQVKNIYRSLLAIFGEINFKLEICFLFFIHMGKVLHIGGAFYIKVYNLIT